MSLPWVAGLIIGNYGRIFSMSPGTRLSLTHFWDVAAFIINGLLFLLIGLTVERGRLFGYGGEIVLVFAVMLVARSAVVYGIVGAYRATSRRCLPAGWAHVVNSGGVRGSIPVALALGLPLGLPRLAPQIGQLQTITLGAVFLSLMVQGLSIKQVLVRLGLVSRSDEERDFERAQGSAIAARAALTELESLHHRDEISDVVFQRLREHFIGVRSSTTAKLGRMTEDHEAVRHRQLGRATVQLFAAERAALDAAFRRGLIGEEIWRELKEEVDARLVEGEEAGWERLWHEERVEIDEPEPREDSEQAYETGGKE